jgi:hypothetical protein
MSKYLLKKYEHQFIVPAQALIAVKLLTSSSATAQQQERQVASCLNRIPLSQEQSIVLRASPWRNQSEMRIRALALPCSARCLCRAQGMSSTRKSEEELLPKQCNWSHAHWS